MKFLDNLFNKDRITSLEIEVRTLRANFKMLLDEYRLHLKQLHDPYKRVMIKAEDVKKENKKRGRKRRENK